jgi:hypothetical protein
MNLCQACKGYREIPFGDGKIPCPTCNGTGIEPSSFDGTYPLPAERTLRLVSPPTPGSGDPT